MVADAQSDNQEFKLEGVKPLDAMRQDRRWVVWRLETDESGRQTKRPYRPEAPTVRGDVKLPESWSTYEQAVAVAEHNNFDGIGFVLTEHEEICALDLDDCRDPETGQLSEWARSQIAKADSYTEITPSGYGFRIIGVGTKREGNNRNIKVPNIADFVRRDGEAKAPHVEAYIGRGRFITFTGKHFAGSPETLQNIDHVIDDVLDWAPETTFEWSPEDDQPDPGAIRETLVRVDILKIIREGVQRADKDRSADFHKVVCHLRDQRYPLLRIIELLRKHPDGIAEKYLSPHDRLDTEAARCYSKKREHTSDRAGDSAKSDAGGPGGDNGASRGGGADAANDSGWPEPVDFLKGQTAPQFPLECLPEWFAEIISAYSQSLGTAVPGVAMAFLAACAGAIPNQCRVRVYPGRDQWVRKPRLWVSLIGNSAAGKSPVMRAALAPLEDIDSVRRQIYQEEMATWNACEREKKGSGGPEPILRLGIVKDTTVEKLQIRQSQNPSGVIVHKDEMASWFGSMEKYSGGKAAHYDRAYYLSCYDGGPQTSDRVTRGYISIDDCGIDFLGGVVGESLRELTGKVQNDGLFQRFIPVHLPNRVRGTGPVPQEQVDLYGRIISDLNSMPAATIEFDMMTDAARKRYSDQWFELQDTLAGHWEPMAAAVAKYDNLLVQLAALLMLIENHDRLGVAQTIGSKHVHSACRIIDQFVKPNHYRFFTATVMSADDDAARQAAHWILSKQADHVLPHNLTNGIQVFRKGGRELINDAMDRLDTFGWVVTHGEAWRPKSWQVNPRVHTLFADMAERERERRKAVREMIEESVANHN